MTNHASHRLYDNSGVSKVTIATVSDRRTLLNSQSHCFSSFPLGVTLVGRIEHQADGLRSPYQPLPCDIAVIYAECTPGNAKCHEHENSPGRVLANTIDTFRTSIKHRYQYRQSLTMLHNIPSGSKSRLTPAAAVFWTSQPSSSSFSACTCLTFHFPSVR